MLSGGTSRAMQPRRRGCRGDGGFTLIEVLVTVLLITVGLLGVVAMQTRAATVEFESYQRGQALSLLREMEARLAASRGIVAEFLAPAISSTDGSVHFGSGATGETGLADCSGTPTGARAQLCAWSNSLQGAAAVEGGGNVGAMIGARGCLMRVEPPQANALADVFVVVVWQGMTAGAEPPADSPAGANGCASGVDFGAGLRRGASLRVMVPNLTQTL